MKHTVSRRRRTPAVPDNAVDSHHAIVEGYPIWAVAEAAQSFGVTTAEMAKRIGVSRSSLHRKLAGKGRLSEHESDALARHLALFAHATAVFDDDSNAARQWLTTPQIGLGGAVPVELARTTFGFQEVETLLVRIDYGVYA